MCMLTLVCAGCYYSTHILSEYYEVPNVRVFSNFQRIFQAENGFLRSLIRISASHPLKVRVAI